MKINYKFTPEYIAYWMKHHDKPLDFLWIYHKWEMYIWSFGGKEPRVKNQEPRQKAFC